MRVLHKIDKKLFFAVAVLMLAVQLIVSPIANAAHIYNSTNELNKNKQTPGRIGQTAPYVDFVSNTSDSVSLRFFNHASGLAFFEVRRDGVATGTTPHPVVTGDTIHTEGVSVTSGATVDRTFTGLSEKIEIRLALGGERDWDFDWTRFDVAPSITPCVTSSTIHTDNLTTWDLSQTRATGHNELATDGVRVWTEGATSTDKAAGYLSTNFALINAGIPNIEFASYTGGRPSLQLGIDTNADGIRDAYLVYEPWAYGEGNYWATAYLGVPAGMGYASFGTLNDFLAANPSARIMEVGYSLGSGVMGDAIISKLTAGCVEYTFASPVTTPPAQPDNNPGVGGGSGGGSSSSLVTSTPAITPVAGTAAFNPIFNVDFAGTANNTEGDVLGTAKENNSATKAAQTNIPGVDKEGKILGLRWYWWLAILAGVASGLWWLFAVLRRRKEQEEA